jgi:hypothetical protein
MASELTQERLKELLSYDAETGLFTWLKRCGQGSHAKIGSIAGHAENGGYVRICVDGKLWRAHRLAWLYVYGTIPHVVDHINRNPSDNRICNLRLASKSTNSMNRVAVSKHGFKGIGKSRGGKFESYIGSSRTKTRRHLGTFDTLEDAAKAYDAAAIEIYGEFALLNFPNLEARK